MATYTAVPKSVPSNQRTALITDVAVGDRIDFVDVLGRPARTVQIYTTNAADIVAYRLNNKVMLTNQFSEPGAGPHLQARGLGDQTEVWLATDEFTSTGAVIELLHELRMSSIDITDLTLDVGTTVSIVVT